MPNEQHQVISVAWVERRLHEIEQEIANLRSRQSVYRELLEAAPRVDATEADLPAPLRTPTPSETGESKSVEPSAAIDELVEKEPGLTRKEIANRVEPVVTSDAKNVRAVLFTHMRRREQAGEYYKDDKGRLYHKDHPKAIEAQQGDGARRDAARSW